jgi:hypothetical protein
MVKLLAGAQLVLLLGMIAVSGWGWKHLSPETRIRARAGTSGIDWTMSKKTTLLMTPLIGLFVLVSTVSLRDSENAELGAWLGTGVMAIFLAAHWYSIKRAAR